MNKITNSTQYTLGTMEDGFLLKPDVLFFQNCKQTSPYIPSTNNSAKNKGKEKSSRATYRKYSQTRNSHTKIPSPMVQSILHNHYSSMEPKKYHLK